MTCFKDRVVWGNGTNLTALVLNSFCLLTQIIGLPLPRLRVTYSYSVKHLILFLSFKKRVIPVNILRCVMVSIWIGAQGVDRTFIDA